MDTVIESIKYLDPTNDIAFKKVFMDENRLRNFLNAILRKSVGEQIEEIEYLSQDLIPDIGQGKRGMFDLKCKDQAGRRFIIEMQNENKPFFLNRVQLYGSHTYVSQLGIGEPHSCLLPVVVIVVIKETLFSDKEIECINYHKTVELKTGKQCLNGLSYVFVELSKFHKTAKELKTIEDYWLYFLTNSVQKTEPPATINDRWVLEAYKTIARFNWSDVEYDAYFRARLSLEAEDLAVSEGKAEGETKGRAEGEAKGRAEGEAKGKAEERIEIAKNMLSKKMNLKLISEITGLSEAEIKQLKN